MYYLKKYLFSTWNLSKRQIIYFIQTSDKHLPPTVHLFIPSSLLRKKSISIIWHTKAIQIPLMWQRFQLNCSVVCSLTMVHLSCDVFSSSSWWFSWCSGVLVSLWACDRSASCWGNERCPHTPEPSAVCPPTPDYTQSHTHVQNVH